MNLSYSRWIRVVSACLSLVVMSCSTARQRANSLPDGLYAVVTTGRPDRETIVGLSEKSVKPTEGNPQTLFVRKVPVLRFGDVDYHEFQFDANRACTRFVMGNTENLKEFTRNNIGEKLAVVIDGEVISSHKIRKPVESPEVVITFCGESTGDHVHQIMPTEIKSKSSDPK